MNYQDESTKANQSMSLWQFLQNLRYALRLLWQTSPRYTIALILITVLQSPTLALQLWLTKIVIDNIVAADQAQSAQLTVVLWPIGIMVVLYLFTNALQQLALVLNKHLSDRLTERLSDAILQHANRLDTSFFETPHFHNSLQRAQRESSTRPIDILQQLIALCQSIVTLLSLIAILLQYNLLVMGALILAALISFVLQSRLAVWEFMVFNWQIPTVRRLNYFSYLLTSKETANEVRIYGLGEYFRQKHQELLYAQNAEKRQVVHQRALRGLLMGSISTLILGGIVTWFANEALHGTLSIGDLTLLIAVTISCSNAIAETVNGVVSIYQAGLFLHNLEDFFMFEPRLHAPADPKIPPSSLHQGLTLEKVSFIYPGQSNPVLQDITLSIQPGELLAIVGENGVGKTTLLKLLTRLYDPSSGRILMDGIDLKEFDITLLRQKFSVMFQDFVPYMATVEENIGYGDLASLDDKEAIRVAAVRSGADAFIRTLPHGYQTMLGLVFSNGFELSGGQWQMLALARALLRNAPIIILDEPTSALSPSAESKFFQNLRHLLAKGQIGIIISHRFSTVRHADRIVVIEHGRIQEIGRHEDLMALGGFYARMYKVQAADYFASLDNLSDKEMP
ncbi:ABC transporter ATP-binding protein [Roseiflexus sp.]